MTNLQKFQKKIWTYYKAHKRDMPWRQTHNLYKIWISEIMLQQTQVSRVIGKYATFIKRYPTVTDLAQAPLRDVLEVWSGLGYNRRAKMLHQAAKLLSQQGFPKTQEQWGLLPGIGVNTA
ncbi:MAG: A/G-specific adenine glycosylase, partial [bacterium]|nr:A/G-specific adenine glycosylase [bacterium]